MANYEENYEHWRKALAGTDFEPEIDALSDNKEELEDSFYTDLEFGTAGMRGTLGLGTNRMNIFTVRRATQALADYINGEDEASKGVAIAYDTRRNSELFANEAASVLLANGIKVYLYDSPHSVPQLSFAVRELGTAAGIVITASHNPPQYNGYKVYGPDGAQLPVSGSDKIEAAMRDIDYFNIETASMVDNDMLEMVGKKLDDIYIGKVKSIVIDEDAFKKEAAQLNVVYTPLYGTGLRPVVHALKELGFDQLYVVPQQEFPDPDFPTLSAPNPENPEAFDLAILLANDVNANFIIATDPDSDRLGVAVRNQNGEFTILTGNQIGCMLLDYILTQLKKLGKLPADGFVVKSLVSTDMADAIAASFGIEIRNVYTGFKNIAEQIKISEETGKGTFLFGFEESYGFLRGAFVRDKDAVQAATLVAEAACAYAEQGKTLYDAVQDMYFKYGWFKEKVLSTTLEGREGIERIQNAMVELRKNPPKRVGEQDVIRIEDYEKGTDTNLATGEVTKIDMEPMNVLVFVLQDGRFIIRPSGTEPKIKAYLTVRGNSNQDAEAMMQSLEEGAVNALEKALGIGA